MTLENAKTILKEATEKLNLSQEKTDILLAPEREVKVNFPVKNG